MAAEQTAVLTDSRNPVFCGKRLVFQPEVAASEETRTVYRAKDTIFGYTAWPSVCRDENGVLYATSSAFGTDHMCPFAKLAMYVSRDGGRKWSPPIIVVDSYLPDGSGGIDYLGNGRLLLSWAYHPGDVLYNDYYARICGTLSGCEPDALGRLCGAMLNLYPELPAEKLIGGSFVKVSEDYGMTWSDPIRIPAAAPHGAAVCRDGTVILLGKEYYKNPAPTAEAFASGKQTKINAGDYSSFIHSLDQSRVGRECGGTPIVAIASRDGGYTWETRGVCEKPSWMKWSDTSEPHVTQLADGTLLGAIRVENEAGFENDYTVYTTRSEDGGYTWSEWVCTHIAGSPPHLLQHSSGAVVCSVGRRCGEVLGSYAVLSTDGGRSWTREYRLSDPAPDSDLGYPASAELADGSIATVYYQKAVDPETGKKSEKPCIFCSKWSL